MSSTCLVDSSAAHGSANIGSVHMRQQSGCLPQVFGFPGQAPIAGTEGEFSASVIGCTYYIIVAVIWSMIWCAAASALHMRLDASLVPGEMM